METQLQVLPDLLDREVPKASIRALKACLCRPETSSQVALQWVGQRNCGWADQRRKAGAHDLARIAERIDTYTDVGLDAADASIVEGLDQTVIATLDERAARIIRPKHTEVFELLPGPA